MKSFHHRSARGLTRIGTLLIGLLLAAAGRADGSLVAAYSFNEGMGTTVADASGNGNNGTINGATWTSAGRYGNALSFSGIRTRVTIPDSASLDLTTGMTLEAWVNPSTVNSAWRDVIYKGDDNYYLEATSSHNATPGGGGTFNGADNAATFGTAPLAANTWTHLAVTYDGATVRLYVNGAQLASGAQTGNILTSANALQIGSDNLYGQYFQGMIDEVRVYNVALTAAQIQSDMNTPVGTVPPDTQPPTVANGVMTSADSTSQITIRWNAASDSGGSVAGYRVYRNGTLVATTQSTSYSDNGLNPATQYCYTVVAFDSAGNSSSVSAQACATTPTSPSGAPIAPSNLAATAVAATSARLNWQDNSTNELGFQIERAPAASGPWVIVGTTGANVTSYSNTGLSPATVYYYRVSAFN
jgi:hypothetical protein